MEKFVVSARKYRPSTFDSVVGQQSITDTLKNAIKTNHLAQAYLFCGSRGVGKTTCARILAKTINCANRTDQIEACNQCDSCKSFNDGNSLNILEMDAASNNSVDNIRELTDQVRFAPQIGNYKVYIIDEVHMLSQAAFNAFLKTLEEPPAHAIFILATTEKHKIIPTILSRCQIFDFNRIRVEDISAHLASIAEKEGIEAEEQALHTVAQKADGALRDALSIFDQLVSFSGRKLAYEDVITNLNILDYDYYFRCTEILDQGNIPPALLLFDEIRKRGFDGHLFINGLAAHLRNLLVCQDELTLNLLEAAPSIKDRYREQAGKVTANFIMKALEICAQCDYQYKGSKNQRLLVELSLMQMASIHSGTGRTAEKKKHKIASPEVMASVQRSEVQHSSNGEIDQKDQTKASAPEQSRKTDSATAQKLETESQKPEENAQRSDGQSTEIQNAGDESPEEQNSISDSRSPVTDSKSLNEEQEAHEKPDSSTPLRQAQDSAPDVTDQKSEIKAPKVQPANGSALEDDSRTQTSNADKQGEGVEQEVENPQKPAPKKPIVSDIQPDRTRALSIHALTSESKKDPAEKATEAFTSDHRNEFSQEELMEVWKALNEKIENESWEGASMIISALNSRAPKILDDFKIGVLVDNKSQAEELMLRRTELHDFLRKKLLNGALEVVIKVNKNKELKKAYTDEEKFKEMAEDNPNVLKLRQQFDLDFL